MYRSCEVTWDVTWICHVFSAWSWRVQSLGFSASPLSYQMLAICTFLYFPFLLQLSVAFLVVLMFFPFFYMAIHFFYDFLPNSTTGRPRLNHSSASWSDDKATRSALTGRPHPGKCKWRDAASGQRSSETRDRQVLIEISIPLPFIPTHPACTHTVGRPWCQWRMCF